jgi:hypothetical protein
LESKKIGSKKLKLRFHLYGVAKYSLVVNFGQYAKHTTRDRKILRGEFMERKRFIYVVVMGLIGALLISACASQGRLRVQSGSDMAMAMKDIIENHDKYIIHANEWPAGEVSAMVFDPKGDNKIIENDGWTLVNSKEQLSKLIDRSRRLIYRQFFKILGPDGQLFGYLLGGSEYVWIQTIDDSTLKLNSINWVPYQRSRYDPFMY